VKSFIRFVGLTIKFLIIIGRKSRVLAVDVAEHLPASPMVFYWRAKEVFKRSEVLNDDLHI